LFYNQVIERFLAGIRTIERIPVAMYFDDIPVFKVPDCVVARIDPLLVSCPEQEGIRARTVYEQVIAPAAV